MTIVCEIQLEHVISKWTVLKEKCLLWNCWQTCTSLYELTRQPCTLWLVSTLLELMDRASWISVTRWPASQVPTFSMGHPHKQKVYFRSCQQQILRQYSNSYRWTRRKARWPLDHHHGPKVPIVTPHSHIPMICWNLQFSVNSVVERNTKNKKSLWLAHWTK